GSAVAELASANRLVALETIRGVVVVRVVVRVRVVVARPRAAPPRVARADEERTRAETNKSKLTSTLHGRELSSLPPAFKSRVTNRRPCDRPRGAQALVGVGR